MTYEEIPNLDFIHGAMCIVDRKKFTDFIIGNGLSQYGNSDSYGKDNRIFSAYFVGDMLEVQIVNKDMLPKVNF